MKIARKLVTASVALAAMSLAPSVASAATHATSTHATSTHATSTHAAATHAASTKAKVEVKLATVGKYGKILENQAGLALYYDTAVKPPSHWACKGSCLTAWPPLVLPKGQRAPVVAAGVTGISTVKGPSGIQVTWHSKPLYSFVRDKAGQVNGQGVGGVWYVAQLSAAAKTKTTSGSGY